MLDTDTDDLYPVFVLLLSVVAVSLMAATITSTTGGDLGQGQIQVDQSNIDGSEEQVFNDTNSSRAEGSPGGSSGTNVDLTVCMTALTKPPAILGIVAGTGLLLFGIKLRFNSATALLSGSAFIPILLLSYFFMTNCAGGGTRDGVSMPNPMSGDTGTIAAPSAPPLLVVGVLGVVLIGAVVLLISATGSDDELETIEEEDDGVESPDSSQFARAAERAADRIAQSNVPVDNAVYQAWAEMTALLDLSNPDTSTPMDFAESAVEAGLNPDDVKSLTTLFTEVRYGRRDPEEREELAMDILRNIESTYGTTGDESGGDQHGH